MIRKKNRAVATAVIVTFALTFSSAAVAAQMGSGEGGGVGKGPANSMTRQGVHVEFKAKPVKEVEALKGSVYAGGYTDIEFLISDASSGEPLRAQYPGVWIDFGKTLEGDEQDFITCKDRVGMYLQGNVGIRPMIDLNSYFVLAMNLDASISVIDPIVGITGITKLYTQVTLDSPGADWTKTADDSILFVTMPRIGQLAVVNTDSFRVIKNVPAGDLPMRVSLLPDGKYLFVGNDSREEGKSGVTVIDAAGYEQSRFIPTGKGHHEIAFSDDSRYAFVSNRVEGTVSVIDVNTLEKVKDVKTGPSPLSMDYSSRSGALYVTDGKSGVISVIDSKRLKEVARIEAAPGLGPIRFSQDGRWGVAVNTLEDLAYVVDPATNGILHSLKVEDEPYQVAFSRSFAYVQSLGSERVSMINLSQIDSRKGPPVVSFGAGALPPNRGKSLLLADSIVEAPGEAAVLVMSPAENTIYYYMEGMNAPMGNFRNYGHMPRAVQVVDRSLREKEPGRYYSRVKIPEPGIYDVAFLLESPSILHCFQLAVKPDPFKMREQGKLVVEYLIKSRLIPSGETYSLRFKITDTRDMKGETGIDDVKVLYYLAPGKSRTEVRAKEVGEGIYEAKLPIDASGAYYVYVGSSSRKLGYSNLPYLTLRAVPGGGKK